MPHLTINGHEVEVVPGTSILQACEQLGIEIPRFCYHDRLSVPANCRMCLVEMEGAPKPVPSCAMACSDDMVIKTDSELVHDARKGVMEFLLINHPLDCPICDQGGECDLQDQAMAYGFDRSRYSENKRAVKDKNLGPFIKTHMTRCIHCTRCVRFGDQIAGISELGTLGRGEDMEIGTFVEQAVSSELSGNMIDICPVGALTSKPYAFTARPWELKRHETIDVTDAVGSNIIADTKGPAVMRILPRLHEDINEEWIHDKIRFCYDGLKKQRLDRPYRRNSDGKLMPVTWDDALEVIADHIKQTNGSNIAALAGDLADVESMYALKSFMQKLGSDHYDARIDGMKIMPNPEHRGDYLFNTTIAGIEQADAILIIGSNPRHEAALINARIRKTWLNDRIPIGLIGPGVELTYPYTHIGTGGGDLLEFAHGNHDFYKKLVDAERPMVILGAGALNRTDGGAIHDVTRRIAQDTGMVRDDWNGFNILHTDAARVGALEIGFSSTTTADIIKKSQVGAMDIIYLHGVDRPWVNDLDNSFVIYQGHHGDRGAAVADVILPGAAFTEKNALYVNTEGRPQVARLATNPPGQAREDWKIIRRLADELDMQLGFDTVAELRQIIIDQYPHLGQVDQITPGAVSDAPDLSQIDEILGQDFNSPVDNFYQTDVITRASTNMAKATEQLLGRPHHRANDELEPIIPNVMEADG